MKFTKVMSYQIVKPTSDSWDVLGPILRKLQNETRNTLNKAIQLCWEWQGFSSNYYQQHGSYPSLFEITGYKQLHGHVYNELKDQFPSINKGNFSQTIKRATDKWKADVKEILRGDRSIPSFKKNVPIDVVSSNIEITKSGPDYIIWLSLIAKPIIKELGKKDGKLPILIKVEDKSQRVILDRILADEYKISASQLIYHKKKKKWFLNLSYTFEAMDEPLDSSRIMGIDMGLKYPLYMAFNDSLHRYHVEGGEIERFRQQVEKRRKQLLKQGKYCGEGRQGHGRQTRIQPIEAIGKKIAHFRETTNHKYARYVVNLALKHRCGTIQMEDLEGIHETDTFLKNWTYSDLQQKIEYKAKEVGIQVVKVKPNYTSQRCSKCGHIAKENRVSQSDFHCVSCGFKTLADYNAARNLSIDRIDEIIQEQLNQVKIDKTA